MLVSVAAAGFAGKKAAASAAGFTGLWGYVGAVASGVGIGWIAQHHGWNASFAVLALSGVLSAACFALTWRVGASVLAASSAPTEQPARDPEPSRTTT
jgi:OPA family glycerol-3-phosphate transporter-like MFS transporter/OPA family sugar phosphate sensor protein UhpC-like MFS transporter